MIRNAFRAVFFTPVGVLILSSLLLTLALWYLGPLVAIGPVRPFDGFADRVLATLSLAAATIIAVLTILLTRRATDSRLTEEITQTEETAPQDEAVKAELAELGSRMRAALKTLRGARLSRFGSRHLYQLPWYIIIGPPGAGKTTAIVNSGLKFPLAETMGTQAVGGIGGTRNCDWWFTNDAVLIDTAGRYTTQDSDASADAKAWTGFLTMLKKYRKRQPINGALVAISLSDLSNLDAAARAEHARAIRVRLQELREKLGVRFPVYVLFTKADLIAGFQEFFDTLSSKEAQQVWGLTLPLETTKKGAPPLAQAVTREYDALLAQLSEHSLERIQSETDFQRRSLIAGFPAQMAALRDVTERFLDEVFQESRYADNQLLRGVYFTSGTQEGMPIDRLMAGMAQTFGIGRQAIGAGRGQGRSFFLTQLMGDVIFHEAGLVSADDAVERRYRWTARGAIVAGVALVGLALGLLGNSFVGNRALIAEAGTQISAFRTAAAALPPSPIEDQDIAAIVPALNILRDLPGNPAALDPEPPRALTYGLYQGDVLGTETGQNYRAALNTILLPRLLVRLETQIQSNLNNGDFLFEALKTYLMLGLQVPMDGEHVRQWMTEDWENLLPTQPQLRADLLGHLTGMLNQPMQEIGLNGPMIEQARGILAETPLSERVYLSIVTAPQAQALRPFRITDVGGPAAARVLVRPSGRPLSAGVEGVYTHAGFYDYVLPEILIAAERVQSDAQILGPAAGDGSAVSLALLSRDVLALYENDYVTRYDDLLADIDILPMASLAQATDVINILSGPVSPLRNILEEVSKQTRLAQPPAADVATNATADRAQKLAIDQVVSNFGTDVEILFGTFQESLAQIPGQDPVQPGQFVEARFQSLHRLTDRSSGQSELDRAILLMTDVYDELNRLSLGQNLSSAVVGGANNASARLQAEIGRMPAPLERWATQVVAASAGAAVGGVRNELNAKWKSEVLPFCQQAIEGRYPFNRQARADVALQDFGRLFGPSGLLHSFFEQNLAQFVDTTTDPWQVRRVNGVDIGISQAVVRQFQNADEIRNAFFLAPGLPSVTFNVTPAALDPTVAQVTLDVDGQQVIYAHGPPQVSALRWPGTGGARTRIAFSPPAPGRQNDITHDGPWSLFRMLDSAELRRTNVTDRNRVVFNVGGRIAIFELRAGTALNPFTLGALAGFSCPTSM
ncbi:type VI secretion system membrane subunit TssM [Thalassobius sp. S69A]|uniref:type VI secretion system membrane subunit TssM n=1 Tax=unclassified Thalassovita TaxID=2619711 RepID=UPI000C0CB0C5|nr:type VI secretion system membrane subunit TssM [Paracoccaceae bacterium]MBT25694.1 type VI secretion system membrane subunit TssM [Paracoccaceae bacterium]